MCIRDRLRALSFIMKDTFRNIIIHIASLHDPVRQIDVYKRQRVDGVSYRFMGADKVEVTPVIGTAVSGLWEATYTFELPRCV